MEAMAMEITLVVSEGDNTTSPHCQGSSAVQVVAAPELSKTVWSGGDSAAVTQNPQIHTGHTVEGSTEWDSLMTSAEA